MDAKSTFNSNFNPNSCSHFNSNSSIIISSYWFTWGVLWWKKNTDIPVKTVWIVNWCVLTFNHEWKFPKFYIFQHVKPITNLIRSTKNGLTIKPIVSIPFDSSFKLNKTTAIFNFWIFGYRIQISKINLKKNQSLFENYFINVNTDHKIDGSLKNWLSKEIYLHH